MSFLDLIVYPFSLFYDVITRFRNYLYDIGYKKSFEFETNVISVGNLSVGGTGKTPMIEYLIRLLYKKHRIVTLSRGYGRITKGFKLAGSEDSAKTLGDEPYQFYTKYNSLGINVAVGEERAVAIPFILAEIPETEVILLDDAYQHRSVKPGLNILLTDYNHPFYNDCLLPSGRLREAKKGASRANIIVVTKCPGELSYDSCSDIETKIRKYNTSATIAFTTIKYKTPVAFSGEQEFSDHIILISGIADVNVLRNYIREKYHLVGEVEYRDHHRYNAGDIEKIRAQFEQAKEQRKCIVTTEKDMVRLKEPGLSHAIKDLPFFYIPIEVEFLKGGKTFDAEVLNFIRSYS